MNPPTAMLPIEAWPAQERADIDGVLADIDDTLTTDGYITADALAALHALKDAGLMVVLATGRPAAWSKPFASAWPVHAIVAENGALALVRGAAAHDVQTLYQQDAATRAANYKRMQQVAARILREVPGAVLAQDSAGRETDIAVDHSEFTQMAPEQRLQVQRIMRDQGMNASISSIHINGWFGVHDKWQGARWILRELFARALDAELPRWAYIGDSTNDQVMFQHLPFSVGVANIGRFVKDLKHPPRYLCKKERGAGFAEFAAALLSARAIHG